MRGGAAGWAQRRVRPYGERGGEAGGVGLWGAWGAMPGVCILGEERPGQELCLGDRLMRIRGHWCG